jgi:hypothetical protein
LKDESENLVVHGMPEIDAEKNVECLLEIMTYVLHMNFTRNVDKMQRIGRLVEGKSRPLSRGEMTRWEERNISKK